MTGRVHVIGAGLAGLSAATLLAERGAKVTLSEALGQAGGRCRSAFEPALGMEIDNGSHLVLSGNWAARAYLDRIGASDALAGPDHAEFSFCDLSSNQHWRLRLNDGPLPWWVFCADRRVPGTTPLDYARFGGLLYAAPTRTIGEIVRCDGVLWDRLLRPLLLAVMNTDPAASSAALAAKVLRETLLKGGCACRPCIATPTLSAAFVDPALKFLAGKGTDIRLRRKLLRIDFSGDRAASLHFPDGAETLEADDAVVLAVPAWFARELIPGLSAPSEFRAIVNLHFASVPPPSAPRMLGCLGGTAEWIFAFEKRIAVTISDAEGIAGENRDVLAARVWADVCRAYGMTAALPPFAVVRERRATFAATPDQDAKRPGTRTRWGNVFLAGDWTATGLPSTIEGSLRSGIGAAEEIVGNKRT
jgi:hydroxysqualene dehydroxylase